MSSVSKKCFCINIACFCSAFSSFLAQAVQCFRSARFQPENALRMCDLKTSLYCHFWLKPRISEAFTLSVSLSLCCVWCWEGLDVAMLDTQSLMAAFLAI
jgi:hypothetical protein